MIRLIGILLIGLYPLFLSGQEQPMDLVYQLERPHHFIWTDNLQNLYLINESGIEMYPPDGELRFENSQLNLGEIDAVDFNFTLKPMLFFSNMNTIVILDNTLSMQGNPVRLSEYGLNWVTAAAKSVDNHYWFFDIQTFELIRTDISFNKVRTSGNVSQLLGVDIRPNYITEYNNWVFVNNPETGILVFDIFGTYFKQIPITGLDSFQVTDQHILYFKDGLIHQYNRRTFDTITQSLPVTEVAQARVVKDMLFLSTGNKVMAFRKR